jgi:hypothetical protein
MILVMSQIEKPSDNRLYAVEAGVIEPILVSLKCKVIAVGILRRLARGPWNGSFGASAAVAAGSVEWLQRVESGPSNRVSSV